jgi:S1-C subfamily serine protease
MRRSRAVVVAPAARWRWSGWPAAWPAVVTVAVTALLFGLGVANLVIRATWHEADDGVLWVDRVEGVTAFGVAPGTPAARAGIRPGDLLAAIDGDFVERPSDVTNLLRRAKAGQPVTYRLLRLGTAEAFDFRLASIPRGNTSLYYVLAPVGLFTLLVGART